MLSSKGSVMFPEKLLTPDLLREEVNDGALAVKSKLFQHFLVLKQEADGKSLPHKNLTYAFTGALK